MIEDELKQIEEESKALQETLPKVKNYTENGNMTESEVINTNETYEELTERLLKVANTIQESAKSLGQEEIDLSPRINKIQLLKEECQRQPSESLDEGNTNIPKENEEKISQEIIECEELNQPAAGKEDQTARMSNSQPVLDDFKKAIENETETDRNAMNERDEEENCEDSQYHDIESLKIQDDQSKISENSLNIEKQGQKKVAEYKEDTFQSINAVPKIRFKSNQEMFQTNQKRNTIDLAQFERAKVNQKIRNIFEDNENVDDKVQVIRQPKKKLITLEQVLIKSPSRDMNHEKETELENVKTLRKNWVPPEDVDAETSKNWVPPEDVDA